MKAEDERDRSVEQLLRRSLRDSGASRSESCLDAETLSAWIDGGLDAQALMMVEAHASGCARCQALVGVMGRSAPDVPMPAPWWRREWNLRWLVPLSASAAALALWMVVPGQRPVSPSEKQAESQARADAPASRVAPAPGLTQRPPATPVLTDQLQAQTPAIGRERSDAPASTTAREQREAPATAPRTATKNEIADARTEPKAPRTLGESALGKIASDSAKAPAPPAQGATDKVVAVAGAGERNAAPTPAAAAETAAPFALRRSANEAREIVSPDPAIRWRLGRAGSVEYSSNGGATWEPLSTGVSAELTAGSSPSASVCWLIGRGGVVLLTTDGRRWQRVPFPEAADLAAVQATDASRASIITIDGRTFRTEDAGQTWSRVSPQDW